MFDSVKNKISKIANKIKYEFNESKLKKAMELLLNTEQYEFGNNEVVENYKEVYDERTTEVTMERITLQLNDFESPLKLQLERRKVTADRNMEIQNSFIAYVIYEERGIYFLKELLEDNKDLFYKIIEEIENISSEIENKIEKQQEAEKKVKESYKKERAEQIKQIR